MEVPSGLVEANIAYLIRQARKAPSESNLSMIFFSWGHTLEMLVYELFHDNEIQ